MKIPWRHHGDGTELGATETPPTHHPHEVTMEAPYTHHEPSVENWSHDGDTMEWSWSGPPWCHDGVNKMTRWRVHGTTIKPS